MAQPPTSHRMHVAPRRQNAQKMVPALPPLWAFSSNMPRPVRIARRIVWVLAALALIGVGLVLLAQRDHVLSSLGSPSVGRGIAAAALALAVSYCRRHIGWYVALILCPIVYMVVLPWWRWFLLPGVFVLAISYYRCLFESGTAAWFHRDKTIRRALEDS